MILVERVEKGKFCILYSKLIKKTIKKWKVSIVFSTVYTVFKKVMVMTQRDHQQTTVTHCSSEKL